MIGIAKGQAPGILRRRATTAHRLLSQAYLADQADYNSGTKSLKYNNGLYGHDEVRAELNRIQHGKCCYCEAKIPLPYAYGHVEHYRPKGFSLQDENDLPHYPGYYWLAYEWTNLYLSCVSCNSAYKRNYFPLLNQHQRAHDPGGVSDEEPLLIDPGGPDDPRDHIYFDNDAPMFRTERGRVTIQTVGLDDLEQGERRRERLAEIQFWTESISYLRTSTEPGAAALLTKVESAVAMSTEAHAPFSSMARDYLARVFAL